jgi:hypothetical protein
VFSCIGAGRLPLDRQCEWQMASVPARSWLKADTSLTPKLSLLVSVCGAKTVPLHQIRPWRKNGEKFKIQFTDLSQWIVHIQIHEDGALPAYVPLAGLYQLLAWTTDVPSKCRIP